MTTQSFFQYLFVDRSENICTDTDVIAIEEINIQDSESTDVTTVQEKPKPKRKSNQLQERVAVKAILQINKVLAIICILSFITIIVFPIIKVQLPEVISNTFSMTLGYFGSALITFLEKQSKATN